MDIRLLVQSMEEKPLHDSHLFSRLLCPPTTGFLYFLFLRDLRHQSDGPLGHLPAQVQIFDRPGGAGGLAQS